MNDLILKEKQAKWKKKHYDGLPGSVFVRSDCKKIYIYINQKTLPTHLDGSFEESWQIAYNIKRNIYLNETVLNNNPIEKRLNRTLYSVFDEYREEHFHKISLRTQRNYELAFKRIFPQDIKLSLDNVKKVLFNFNKDSVQMVQTKYNTEAGELSKSSKNIYLNNLTSFIKYLEKYIGTIDLSNYKFRGQSKTKKDYTPNEIKLLLQYFDAKDKEISNLLRFMLLTGGRISETLDMSWERIDEDRIIFFNKNDKIEEVFPLNAQLKTLLAEQKQFATKRGNNRQLVFRWQSGSESRLRKKLDTAFIDCGIDKEGRSFHEFRKTFKSRLKNAGISIEDAHILMRHRDISTTMKFYAVQNNEQIRQAYSELEIEF